MEKFKGDCKGNTFDTVNTTADWDGKGWNEGMDGFSSWFVCLRLNKVIP